MDLEMKTEEYTNRYGDIFTFKLNERGNIQWSGNFKYCRFGAANVYDDAYNEYKRDGGTLSMKEFINEVHDIITNENGDYVSPSRIGQSYGELVYSDWNVITMVDPSGGPYITKGVDMKLFGFDGKIANGFIPNEDGYEIVVNNL